MAVLALAVAAGCDSKKEAVMTSGIDLTNLDTTAVQGADFYQYACGGWMKKNPLTNETGPMNIPVLAHSICLLKIIGNN